MTLSDVRVLSHEQVALMVASGWTLEATSSGSTLRRGAELMPFEYDDEEEGPEVAVDGGDPEGEEPAEDEAKEPTEEDAAEEEPGEDEEEPEAEDDAANGEDDEDPRDALPRDSMGRRRAPRISVAEHQARITEVYVSILNGASPQEIANSDSVKEWNVSERQLNNYVRQARAQFTRTAEYVKKEEFGKALARLNDLYGRFMAADDFRGCQGVQRDLTELLGLSEAKPAPAIQITNVKIDVLLQSRAFLEVQSVMVNALSDEPGALRKLQTALDAYAEKEAG